MKYTSRIRKSQQIKFGGLDHRLAAEDGKLWDMKNMTSDHYPALSARPRRRRLRTLSRPGGLYSWNGLCWVDGTSFYFEGKEKGKVREGQKTFASLGSWIVILPDKCCYNVDTEEFRSIEARWEGSALTFDNGKYAGEEAAANAIVCAGIQWSDYFSAGDGVQISGCTTHPENNLSIIIRDMDGDKLYFYENSFTLDGADGTQAYTEKGSLSIARTMPDVKWLCAHENRLWGCKDDMVYACKLGDIFNWSNLDTLAGSAYQVDTGSAGSFTGCISFRGYPTFLKEEHIFKMYGSVTSDFELLGSATLGLAEGSGGSLAVAGETLFYLGRSGVMAYTGGIPQPMGEAFGADRFKNAVAGSDGLKYYISMEGTDGRNRLYVFDTQRSVWHIEDETRVTHFARHEGNLYYLNDRGEIWITGNIQDPPAGAEPEEVVEWMAEFTDFTEEDPNKKGIGKLQIRLELEDGAEARVWIQLDSDGLWRSVSTIKGEGEKRSYYLPIIPSRCDHYRIRLTGNGACRIYSMVRETYSGSELKSKAGRN